MIVLVQNDIVVELPVIDARKSTKKEQCCFNPSVISVSLETEEMIEGILCIIHLILISKPAKNILFVIFPGRKPHIG